MVVGDQGALDGGADEPVVPGAGVEGEQALHDAGTGRRVDAATVAFEAELVLQCPDDRLDALPQPVRGSTRVASRPCGLGGSGSGGELGQDTGPSLHGADIRRP